jgi:hypothetical protein
VSVAWQAELVGTIVLAVLLIGGFTYWRSR